VTQTHYYNNTVQRYFFWKVINTFIQQGRFKLIKTNSEDVYNRDFFQKHKKILIMYITVIKVHCELTLEHD